MVRWSAVLMWRLKGYKTAVWHPWIQQSRLMKPIIMTCFCQNSCRHCHVSGEFFIFQQDAAPAHRGHTRWIIILEREAFEFISPLNIPDINPASWLQNLGHNAAASLPDRSAGCGQFEAPMLCNTWNWSDDNDTVSGIAILDTTAIPEMRSAISMSFRIRQSHYSVYLRTVAVTIRT